MVGELVCSSCQSNLFNLINQGLALVVVFFLTTAVPVHPTVYPMGPRGISPEAIQHQSFMVEQLCTRHPLVGNARLTRQENHSGLDRMER